VHCGLKPERTVGLDFGTTVSTKENKIVYNVIILGPDPPRARGVLLKLKIFPVFTTPRPDIPAFLELVRKALCLFVVGVNKQMNKLTRRYHGNDDKQQRGQPRRGIAAQSRPHLNSWNTNNDLSRRLPSWTWISDRIFCCSNHAAVLCLLFFFSYGSVR